jgi:hypothetical protein
LRKINYCKNFALSTTILNKIDEKKKNFEGSMFQSALRQCLEHNDSASLKKCEKVLKQLYEPIEKIIEEDCYQPSSIQALEQDLQAFII